MRESRRFRSSKSPRARRAASAVQLVVALLLLAWPRVGLALTQLQVPAGCGTVDEFEREVGQRLGRGIAAPETTLEIVPEGEGYRLRMSVGTERRELEDTDCKQLFRAAVVVAVAVTLSESGERPPVAGPAPQSTEPVAIPAAASRGSSLELDLALGGGLNVGLLPGPSLAFELEGRVLWPGGLGFALGARYLAPREHDDGAGRGVTVDAWGGRLAGLYRINPHFEVTLGAAMHRLAGTGVGVGARSNSAWAAGPVVGSAWSPFQHEHIWLALAVELRWNALQPTFEYMYYGSIFSPALFDLTIFVRVGPRFH